MNRDQFDKNAQEILKYSTSPNDSSLILLLVSGSVAQTQAATSSHPEETPSPALQKLVKSISSVMTVQENSSNGKYTSDLIKDLDSLLQGTTESDPIRSIIEETIRITPMRQHSGNAGKHFINGSYLYDKNGSDPKFYSLDTISPAWANNFIASNGIPVDRQKPNVSVIEILKPGLSQVGRDTKEVEIFTNFVTPLEMSRCVPFMRLRIIPPKYVEGEGDKATQIRTPPYFNVIGFLRGDATNIDQSSTAISSVDKALSVTFAPGINGLNNVDGGGSMELFTTPQTMLTPRGNLSNFVNPILDRSRPFLTITSVKFSVQPTSGWYTNKTATVEMVLHDRSRLSLIAPFIKPDFIAGISKTIFEIEYGWSHPDGNKTISGERQKNPIGTFLNGLRCTENYEVYNSSFSFADSGQVNITLQLSMAGHTAMYARVPEITDLKEQINDINELLKRINRTIKTATESRSSAKSDFKEMFGETVMNGLGSADDALSIDLATFDQIRKKIEAVRNNTSQTEGKNLATDILTLVANVKQAQNTVSQASAQRVKTIGAAPEFFPVAVVNGKPSKTVKIPTISTLSPVTKTTVSLGTILYSYVAAPLAATNEYNEVQLIFGVHNERASFMRSLSIARHPIDFEAFESDVSKFLQKKPRMTIADFIGMLNENHIENDYSFSLGFSSLKPTKNKQGQEVSKGVEAINKQDQIIKQDAKIRDGKINKPSIALTTDCVRAKDGGIILRIFVMDKRAVSFQSYVDLLKSSRDVSSGAVNAAALDTDHPLLNDAPEYRWVRKNRTALIKYLQEKKVIKPVKEESSQAPEKTVPVSIDVKSLVSDALSLKRVISKGLPYLRFGQSGGMITSIGVSSLSDPSLAAAALSVAGKKTTYTSAIADQRNGIPMSITPAELRIDMLGCPVVNHMQNFFVDLDTMTSLDSVYTISGIEHSITPGSFNTSFKMVNVADGYASFRSTQTDVTDTVSRWLQVDPDASAAIERQERIDTQLADRRKTQTSNKSAVPSAPVSAVDTRLQAKAEELRKMDLNLSFTKISKLVEEWGKKIAEGENAVIDTNFTDAVQEVNNGVPLANMRGILMRMTTLNPNFRESFPQPLASFIIGEYKAARSRANGSPLNYEKNGEVIGTAFYYCCKQRNAVAIHLDILRSARPENQIDFYVALDEHFEIEKRDYTSKAQVELDKQSRPPGS